MTRTTEDQAQVALGDAFVETLQRCLDEGMQPPFIVCAVAINGAGQIYRITPGEDGECLAQSHAAGGMMQLPINMMVVDQDGDAARVLISANGVTTFH